MNFALLYSIIDKKVFYLIVVVVDEVERQGVLHHGSPLDQGHNHQHNHHKYDQHINYYVVMTPVTS